MVAFVGSARDGYACKNAVINSLIDKDAFEVHAAAAVAATAAALPRIVGFELYMMLP